MTDLISLPTSKEMDPESKRRAAISIQRAGVTGGFPREDVAYLMEALGLPPVICTTYLEISP